MSGGDIRNVDSMGRVVIPKGIRKQLNIENDVDRLEVSVEGDKIILKKHKTACFFCDTIDDMVEYNGYKVCVKCIEKLNLLKSELE